MIYLLLHKKLNEIKFHLFCDITYSIDLTGFKIFIGIVDCSMQNMYRPECHGMITSVK